MNDKNAKRATRFTFGSPSYFCNDIDIAPQCHDQSFISTARERSHNILLRDFSSLRSIEMTDPLGKQPYYYFYFGSDIDVDPKVVLCANLFISTIPY